MSLLKQEPSKNKTSATISIDPEIERLRKDVFRSDMEKFQLLTNMLRVNAMYNRAKITHK